MKPVELTYGRRKVEVRPTIVDRVVNWFNPVAGRDRFQARMQMAMLGGYTGARRDRKQTQGWNTRNGDADSVILPDLPALRDRSRDLERNSPIASGAIATKVTSVIGTGLKPRPAVNRDILRNLTDEQADAWEQAALQEFLLAVDRDDWDVEGYFSFFGSQDIVFRSVLSAGDCLVNFPRIPRPNNPYSIRANFIEADRICNENLSSDTETLVAGVEKGVNGAPYQYHVAKFHPGALRYTKKREWTKLKAFDSTGNPLCLHLYRKLRIGQSRGVPDLAPVIEKLKGMTDYSDSELHAALVSSFFTVFVKSSNPDDQLVDQDAKANERINAKDIKLGSGSVIGLWPDEDIVTANPTRPNAAAEAFLRAMSEEVGVALELPYEILLKHFTASYSAARAALLEMWRFVLRSRVWLSTKYCQPVWEMVITEAIAMGRLPAPGFFSDPLVRRAYLGCEWHGDAMGQLDEVKAVDAANKRVTGGFSTRAEETTKLTGGDWERNHRQQVKEKRLRDRDGLTVVDAAPAAQPVAPATPEEDDKEDTE